MIRTEIQSLSGSSNGIWCRRSYNELSVHCTNLFSTLLFSIYCGTRILSSLHTANESRQTRLQTLKSQQTPASTSNPNQTLIYNTKCAACLLFRSGRAALGTGLFACSRSEQSGLEPWLGTLCCVLGQSLSPPRSTGELFGKPNITNCGGMT